MPLLQPADLGLILSYRCQCGCAHCLYNCASGWTDWMEEEEISLVFEAVRSVWDHRFQVHLSGGEPFLNFPLLLKAVKAAAGAKLNAYVETNAGWCVQAEQTAGRFEELQAAGLSAVMISCSPFHAASIPLRRTLLGIRAAVRVFGAERVMVYLPEWLERIGTYGSDEPVPLERYIEALGQSAAGSLFWRGYGLLPGGRAAYRLGHLAPKNAPEVFRRSNCSAELLHAPHSHFDLYGNFIPAFCGGISLGSWRDLPALLAAYREGHYPPLVGVLIAEGPYGLYALARRDYGYPPLAEGYVGKCHLCVDVRRHLEKLGLFQELEPAEFYERF